MQYDCQQTENIIEDGKCDLETILNDYFYVSSEGCVNLSMFTNPLSPHKETTGETRRQNRVSEWQLDISLQ